MPNKPNPPKKVLHLLILNTQYYFFFMHSDNLLLKLLKYVTFLKEIFKTEILKPEQNKSATLNIKLKKKKLKR